MSDDSNRVILGQIGKVHGIKGWLRLNSFTAPVENILDYPLLYAEFDQRSQVLEIDECKQQPKGLIVHFKGYDNPEIARQLTGLKLSVTVEQLPALDNEEYYWHQLEGLQVVNLQDEVFGKVKRLIETGANDVLIVVATAASIDDKERLIPYLRGSTVVKVDLGKKSITVDWQADYLD